MTHTLATLVLALCCLAGLVLVPLGLPGLWVMVAGVVGYGWLTDFRYGGSSRAGWGALVGGIVGAVVGVPVPIIGSVIAGFVGSFAGAAILEYSRSTAATAVRAGWGAVLGRAAAAAVKIALGIVIAVVGIFAALQG